MEEGGIELKIGSISLYRVWGRVRNKEERFSTRMGGQSYVS
jgi:hypothetical protein